MVRQARALALWTDLQLRQFQTMMRAPLALAGARDTLFW
jgi:hypothetical protein